MITAGQQMAEQANTNTNKTIFGTIIYNVKAYGAIGNGIAVDSSKIASAIAAAAIAGGIVFFPPGTYVTGNQIVPVNVTLQFANGAKLSISTGATVTIDGPIDAGMQQIFSGDGTAAGFGRCERILPHWFGAKGDGDTDDTIAFQKTITAARYLGKIVFIPAVLFWYRITDTLTIPSSVRLVGENVTFDGRSLLKFFMDAVDIGFPAINIYDSDNVQLENVYVQNGGTVKRNGIAIDGTSGTGDSNSFITVKNVISSGWGKAFYVSNTWIVSFRDCYGKASTYGWYIAEGSITTCLIEHCYAESCTEAGYYVDGAYYTTFMNTATDFCKIGFNLLNANTVSMVGCGCEGAISTAINTVSSALTINGFTSVANGTDSDNTVASMLNAVTSKINCRGLYEVTLASPNSKIASVSIDSATTGEYVTCQELLPVAYPKNGRFLFNGQAFTTGIPTATGWLAADIGKVVYESAPVEAGSASSKYVKYGYVRLTTGNGNVLNTDWLQLRALTGN